MREASDDALVTGWKALETEISLTTGKLSPQLDQFGVGGQRWERPAVEPGEHGVGDVAHAGLKRRQDDSSRGRPPEQDGPGREDLGLFWPPGNRP